MLKDLAMALVMTLALEWAFAWLWGAKDKDDYQLVGLANVLTNPAVNLLFSLLVRLWGLPALPVVFLLELSAVAIEWLCYRALSDLYRPFLFSLCANAFSFCAGYLLQLFL